MAQLCPVALSNDAHGNLVATKMDSGISTLPVPRESIFHEGDTVTVKIVAESSGNVTLTPLYPPDPQLSCAFLPFLPSLGYFRCPGNGRPIPIPRAQSTVPATAPALVPLFSQPASQHKQVDDTSTFRLTPGQDSSTPCSRFTIQSERPLSRNESRKAHFESLAYDDPSTQEPENQHGDHGTEYCGRKEASEDDFRKRNAIVLDDCMPNGSQYTDKVIHECDTERQQTVEMSEYLVLHARNGDISANVEFDDDNTENFKNNNINNIDETNLPERASGDFSGIKATQNSQYEEGTIVIDKLTTVTGIPRLFEGELVAVGASAARGRVQASNTDDKGGGTQNCHGPNLRSRAERMESRGWVKVLRPADVEQRKLDETRAGGGGSADDSEDWILVDRTMLDLLAAWLVTSKR
ncbi:MAG: hypothetical protein Q9164_001958 [Protoblastenia rupestris]